MKIKRRKSSYDTSRYLSEVWLAYWEQEIRSVQNNTKFDFKQINLMTLAGHTNAVKSLYALDNESSLLSASKDKTVKVWSLKILQLCI